jgi:hypothetical protein
MLAVAMMAFFSLSGCISSTTPVLGDAKPILGDRGQVHFFKSREGRIREHNVRTFEWSGSHYVFGGRQSEVRDFTVHALEGRDLIVQVTSARPPRLTEYAVARWLSDGVYLLIPINENDVDDATRSKFCGRTQDSACRIGTPEELFVFARATAEKDEASGGIAVIMPSTRP